MLYSQRGIYLLKVSYRKNRRKCGICSKLRIKTPGQRLFVCLKRFYENLKGLHKTFWGNSKWSRSGVFKALKGLEKISYRKKRSYRKNRRKCGICSKLRIKTPGQRLFVCLKRFYENLKGLHKTFWGNSKWSRSGVFKALKGFHKIFWGTSKCRRSGIFIVNFEHVIDDWV